MGDTGGRVNPLAVGGPLDMLREHVLFLEVEEVDGKAELVGTHLCSHLTPNPPRSSMIEQLKRKVHCSAF